MVTCMTTTSEPPNGRLSQSLMCLSPDSLVHRGQGGRQLEFSYFSDSLASTSDTALSLIKKPALHQER